MSTTTSNAQGTLPASLASQHGGPMPQGAINPAQPDPQAMAFNRLCAAGGWSIWLIVVVLSFIIAYSEVGARSVSIVYHCAANAWWLSQSPYTTDGNGFLYLPQSAIVFSPFHFLGVKPGDIAWLWFQSAVLATGMWRLCGKVGPPVFQGRIYLLATAIMMIAAGGNLRNAQCSVLLTGLILHASATLAGDSPRRWISGALLLVAGVAVKPLGIVHLLLNAGIRPRLWLPLAGAASLVAALPFIHPSPAFVLEQYSVALSTIGRAVEPKLDRFNDIRATLNLLDLNADPGVLTLLRLTMAVAVYAAVLAARRHLSPASLACFVATLGAAYLMLFNPRTEGLTYVVLVAPLALYGTALIHFRPFCAPGGWLGWAFCVIALVLGLARVIAGPNSWLRPTATVPLMGFLLVAPLVPASRRSLEIPPA